MIHFYKDLDYHCLAHKLLLCIYIHGVILANIAQYLELKLIALFYFLRKHHNNQKYYYRHQLT